MKDRLRRDHLAWPRASAVLCLIVIAGVATEAGPTAFVAAVLIGVTLYARTSENDELRLLAAFACFLMLGLGPSLIPTASGCGAPLVESAQHLTEPTPHVHGPCEQANAAGLSLVRC